MKKSLYFAFLLLTLLAVTDAKAQNYSSEMGVGDMIKRAWDNAQNSNADIYSEVYDNRYYAAELDYASYLYLGYTHNIVNGNKLSDYSLSSEDSSLGNGSMGNQNQNGAVAVGYFDTYSSAEYPYLNNNRWYQNAMYLPPLNATMCMPINQFYMYRQNLQYECVPCAVATLADIMKAGNIITGYKNYTDVYYDIAEYARKENIDLSKQPFNGDRNYYYEIIHDVAGLNVSSTYDVESYIDAGCAVLGVRSYYPNYVSLPMQHMTTIVGYDDDYYYCIDPMYTQPIGVPISSFNPEFFYGYKR